MSFVTDFKPGILWKHFARILTIPRGSKNEDAMRQYILDFAKGKGLEAITDTAGNVLVKKAPSVTSDKGPVILQSHMDMVNEKNADVNHDFDKDPLIPRQDGDYLYATGTTLGSDNGIGMAAALALLEDDEVEHTGLECLFTVDEETGLTGAAALESGTLKGKLLINLDSEEENAVTVGCAGGAGQDIVLDLTPAEKPGKISFEIKLSGLKGGHSGVDIHLQRGNAVSLLARLLNETPIDFALRLADFKGGNMHNAIPRESSAVICGSKVKADDVNARLLEVFEEIKSELRSVEPDIKMEITSGPAPDNAFSTGSSRKAVRMLLAIPHGVDAMSYDIPDLVETSCNLASAKIENNQLLIHVSSRSSTASALYSLQRRTEAIATLAGADNTILDGYPGWRPDLKSQLMKTAKEAYVEVSGKEPEVYAIHAGLECGIIKKKYPDLDMVSVGPQIEFPHSPDERVLIPSVGDFYNVLKVMLRKIGE
ncbi:MAG: aminoacyl-histidine dipeptidase [Acidobacteriota bacterium]